MLWYLAKGSLNEYLLSQIKLQGHYYSGLETSVSFGEFSEDSGISTFKDIKLINAEHSQEKYVLIIDKAIVVLSSQHSQPLRTDISNITINKLTLNIEQTANAKGDNIDHLINSISLKLAHDYPESYPQISAKLYAKENPSLNAVAYAEKNPQVGPIVDYTKKKKNRGKPEPMLAVLGIQITTLIINTTQDGITNTVQKNNLQLATTSTHEGMISNQIGGEILLTLLKAKYL